MKTRYWTILCFVLFVSCNQDDVNKLKDENEILEKSSSSYKEQIINYNLKIDSLQNLQIIKFAEILQKEQYNLNDTLLIGEYNKIIENYPKSQISKSAQQQIYSINKDKAIQIAKEKCFGKWKLTGYWSSWTNLTTPATEDKYIIFRKKGICEVYKNNKLVEKKEFHFFINNVLCQERFMVHMRIDSGLSASFNLEENTMSLEDIWISDDGAMLYSKIHM